MSTPSVAAAWPHPPAWARVASILAAALILVSVAAWVLRNPVHSQWDYRILHAAAKAHRAGLDAYSVEALNQVSPVTIHFGFVYPPFVLELLQGLLAVNYLTGARVWLFLHLAALVTVLAAWRRLLGTPWWLLAPFALLAYNAGVLFDIRAGNIALFEQALLWWGVVALARGRAYAFVALLLAASLAKGLLIGLGCLLLVAPAGTPRGRPLMVLAAGFALWHLAQIVLEPQAYAAWMGAVAGREQPFQAVNPCLMSLLLRARLTLAPHLSETVQIAAWAAIAGGLATTAWRRIRRRRAGFLDAVAALCLTFGLVAPVFMIYSYALVIPATLHVLSRLGRARAALAAAAVFAVTGLDQMVPETLAEVLGDAEAYLALALVWGASLASLPDPERA